MPKLSQGLRLKLYQYLVERNGERCSICKRTIEQIKSAHEDEERYLSKSLVVHHIDGNPENNVENNLALLCVPCNIKDGWVRRSKEFAFREIILDQVLKYGNMRVDDAVYSMAQLLDCSVITTRRYLLKLVAKKGPLKLAIAPFFDGYQHLVLRESTSSGGLIS